MKVAEVKVLARQFMDLHGLKDWTFDVDKAKRRAGVCKYRKKLITLSWFYIVYNQDKPDDVTDTILHEIAHALTFNRYGPFVAAHGSEWKTMCVAIGAKPVRCYSIGEGGVVMPSGNWQATCPSCSHLFTKHKKPKHLTSMYCVKCGNVKGMLIFAEVTEDEQ